MTIARSTRRLFIVYVVKNIPRRDEMFHIGTFSFYYHVLFIYFFSHGGSDVGVHFLHEECKTNAHLPYADMRLYFVALSSYEVVDLT